MERDFRETTLKVPVQNSETGAVLVIFGILLVVIVMFAALSVDLNRISASHAQQHHSAEVGSLTALKAYFDDLQLGAGHDSQTAFSAAQVRVEEVLGENFLIGSPGALQAQSGEMGSPSADGLAGRLIPGRWWAADPSDCGGPHTHILSRDCPCKSDNSGVFTGPCFEAFPDDTEVATAFKLDLWSSPTSLIKNLFAVVMGHTQQITSASATATLIPRDGMFLVDLSTSTQFGSHPFKGRIQDPFTLAAISPRSESYSYRIESPGITCPNPVDFDNPQTNPCPTSGSCTFPRIPQVFNWYDGMDGDSRDPDGAGPLPPDSDVSKYFRSDYECWSVHYDRGATPTTEHYLVDSFHSAEPLGKIMDGIKNALTALEIRAVPADRVSLLGFDESTNIPQRDFAMTSPSPGNATYASGMKALASSRAEQIKHAFFPLSGAEGDGYNTNIESALMVAKDRLNAVSAGLTSDKFIVLFSDGLSNCVSGVCTGPPTQNHLNSLDQIRSFVRDELTPQNIQLNVFLIGDLSLPSTMVVPSDIGPGCMSEARARELSLGLLTNPFLPATLSEWRQLFAAFPTDATRPPEKEILALPNFSDYRTEYRQTFLEANGRGFPLPNMFWDFARNTGGTWAPIRRPCIAGSDAPKTQLDAACDEVKSMPGFTYDDDADPTTPTPLIEPVGSTTAPTNWGTVSSYFMPTNPKPAWSSDPFFTASGRLLCDPSGQSEAQQIDSYMKDVMGRNPYILVQ